MISQTVFPGASAAPEVVAVAEKAMWYAVYTRSRFEKKVFASLQRADFQVFLPLIKEKRRWSDRFQTVEAPLFPGYVFVRACAQRRQQVYYHPGVVRLVGFEGKPCEIREAEIMLMEKIVAHGLSACSEPARCATGDQVRVVRGPLKGWEGTVMTLKGQSRIRFEITGILQGVSVELDLGNVELLI